jgi:hypothetical protein
VDPAALYTLDAFPVLLALYASLHLPALQAAATSTQTRLDTSFDVTSFVVKSF